MSNLKKNKINFICLAGFMKVLSADFIAKFDGTIINIHPSLLPKYKGLNTHEKAIKNKDDLAELAVDELQDIIEISNEDASALIMKAREHWFN